MYTFKHEKPTILLKTREPNEPGCVFLYNIAAVIQPGSELCIQSLRVVTTRSVPETWFVLRMREIASTSCHRQRFYDSLVKWIILRFIYSFKNFS